MTVEQIKHLKSFSRVTPTTFTQPLWNGANYLRYGDRPTDTAVAIDLTHDLPDGQIVDGYGTADGDSAPGDISQRILILYDTPAGGAREAYETLAGYLHKHATLHATTELDTNVFCTARLMAVRDETPRYYDRDKVVVAYVRFKKKEQWSS